MKLFAVVIFENRYGDAYAKANWIAVANAFDRALAPIGYENRLDAVLDSAYDGDIEAMEFWENIRSNPDEYRWLAIGHTPDEALSALQEKNR